MTLSAPIFYLKRKAKLISRREKVPLTAALDRVAAEEGFTSWSLLAARATVSEAEAAPSPDALFARLLPGDLVLIGARPRQGKTLMGLRLAVAAMKAERNAAFFTLEYTAQDLAGRFAAIGADPAAHAERFAFHDSDAINAGFIIDAMAGAAHGSLAVIDYLQALDQRRDNPDLMAQMTRLRDAARERGHILVFIAQIDRRYEATGRALPDLADVRLPNPLDLTLFDKALFLNDGQMRFATAA